MGYTLIARRIISLIKKTLSKKGIQSTRVFADVRKKLIFYGRVYAWRGLLSIHLWINVN
jgi:hypothetical protein